MAEYGRQRRTLRRLWSLLSVAGTTVGVAATGASSPSVQRESSSAPMMRPSGRSVPSKGSTRTSDRSSELALATPATLDRTPTPNSSFNAQGLAARALSNTGVIAPPVDERSPVSSNPFSDAGHTATVSAPTRVAPPVEPATSTTTATTTTTTAPALDIPAYQRVGEQALARLSYPWRQKLAGWTVVFLPGRPGLLGGTWTYEQRIEVYVRDSQTPEEVAFTLAHEMGHAVDVTLMSEQMRQQWKDARGIDVSVPWWVDSGATDFSSGSGDWAEAFAVWQVGGVSHTRVAPQPDAAHLALLARLSGA